MPPPATAACSVYGPVFDEIEKRLRERYRIKIKEHLAEMITPDMTGTIDPSLGGVIKGLGGPREVTIPGKAAKVIEGKTPLIGITFKPKSFQELLEVFRSALNKRGENAFHYHPLKPAPGGGKINNFLDKAEQFAFLEWLSLSYDQTKVGLTKETEERAWGFREIADSYNTEVGPLEAAGRNTYSGEHRHSLRFGQAPAAYARKIDITSLHVALTPGACNIHIDDVGFVLRGPQGTVGLDPDFLQHLVNELLLKSKLREKFVAKYGESSDAVWAVDHISVVLPSSDVGYMPMVGAKLETEKLAVSAALSFDCKCLPEGRAEMEERFAPRKSGVTFGLGLEVRW